jgi:4-amino-4-deoxy-L-arabinose transferase-like glycosyltransferase
MYGKPGVTGIVGAGGLAATGRPIWGLILLAVLLIVMGLILLRSAVVRPGGR